MENASEIQFDPRFRSTDTRQIRGLFGTIEGFQVKRQRRPRKHIPEWAMDDRSLRLAILFPALRRYRIAYLYWHLGLSAKEVAEEIGITQGSVESVIHNLTRLAPQQV